MILRDRINPVKRGSGVKNKTSYLIRHSVGIKVPPAEGRIPIGTSQANTCTLSELILKFGGA